MRRTSPSSCKEVILLLLIYYRKSGVLRTQKSLHGFLSSYENFRASYASSGNSLFLSLAPCSQMIGLSKIWCSYPVLVGVGAVFAAHAPDEGVVTCAGS